MCPRARLRARPAQATCAAPPRAAPAGRQAVPHALSGRSRSSLRLLFLRAASLLRELFDLLVLRRARRPGELAGDPRELVGLFDAELAGDAFECLALKRFVAVLVRVAQNGEGPLERRPGVERKRCGSRRPDDEIPAACEPGGDEREHPAEPQSDPEQEIGG